jgi:hypothetical protein
MRDDDHGTQGTDHDSEEESSLTKFARKHPVLVFTGAVVLFVLLGFGLGVFLDWYINPAKAEVPSTARKDIVQAVALVLAGLAGIIGVYFTWRNLKHNQDVLRATQKNTADTLKITERGQITERFTRAVDQLGAANDQGEKRQELRLGGIYALERIAIESADEYHWPIMRVLTAYLRQNASWQKHQVVRADADVQAILTVIGQRPRYYEAGEDQHLHLYGTDFSGYDLRGAHLEGAYLINADLGDADLAGAHLARANLQGADLREVRNLEKLEHANGDWNTKLPEKVKAPEWWGALPSISGPLPPQEYSIKVCKVALHFRVGENWHSQLQLPNSLIVTPTGITHTGSLLSFNNIRWVCDPQRPKEEYAIDKAANSTKDMVNWFLKHPHLEIENLNDAEVGGAPGKRLDATVPRDPDKLPLGSSGRPYVPLFPSAPRLPPFSLVEGNRNRIVVLDVEGATLTIIAESRAKDFDQFLKRVQEILDTVRWTT